MAEITGEKTTIELTNSDKVIYKNPKVTKKDIINNY